MASKRFLIVPVLSSAARIPLPLATIAWAMRASSLRFIVLSSSNAGPAAGTSIVPPASAPGGSREWKPQGYQIAPNRKAADERWHGLGRRYYRPLERSRVPAGTALGS